MSSYIKDYYQKLHSAEEVNSTNNGHRLSLTYRLREKVIQFMIQSMAIDSGELNLLDAGCGNGHIYHHVIQPLFDNISYSLGVDYIPDAATTAQQYFNEAKVGDVLNLSGLTDKKFNFVNSTEVFLYIPDELRKTFFKEHIELLQKGGYFLLTVPNLDSIYRKVFKPEKELFPYHFNKETILKLSEKFNIELVSSCGIDIFKNIYNIKDSPMKTLFSFELSFLYRKI